MRKLELIIAVVMLICTIGSLVNLFFCDEGFDMMMTTIAFIFSAAIGLLAANASAVREY
jgi:hypothetical protein